MAEKKVTTKKKKQKKNIVSGLAYISATFNNTMVTITDEQGNSIAWSSAGVKGFKGSRKSTLTLLRLPLKMLVLKQKNLVLRICKFL